VARPASATLAVIGAGAPVPEWMENLIVIEQKS